MKSPSSGVAALQMGLAMRPASTQPTTMNAMPNVTKMPRCLEGMLSENTVVTTGMQEPTPKPAIRRNAAKNARSFANACGSVNRP